jgi:hypothetical protein
MLIRRQRLDLFLPDVRGPQPAREVACQRTVAIRVIVAIFA